MVPETLTDVLLFTILQQESLRQWKQKILVPVHSMQSRLKTLKANGWMGAKIIN
jgi:hypothetical protein